MKMTLLSSMLIVLFGCMYVNAQDLAVKGYVLAPLNNKDHSKVISLDSNKISNEIVFITISAPRRNYIEPVEIPNAYKENDSIDIPNSYRGDRSIEIPNADSVEKPKPILKMTPKLLPNHKK